ncbi:MAG TPA: transcriptional repressor [Aliiroseovarius sp.]|nr:transcriptional repressor [Aliiroseovarius sp.]
MSKHTSESLGFHTHDHAGCISSALLVAEAVCDSNGLHLTPVRRRVLELLLHEHRAMGAYDILDHLRRDGLGSQPPVAYRALDFLVTNGFAHRIERLNAFVACSHPSGDHSPVFLICRACANVAETALPPGDNPVAALARDTGFRLEASVVEAEGLCPNCAREAG